jgi:hypothetical protein
VVPGARDEKLSFRRIIDMPEPRNRITDDVVSPGEGSPKDSMPICGMQIKSHPKLRQFSGLF